MSKLKLMKFLRKGVERDMGDSFNSFNLEAGLLVELLRVKGN